MILRRITIYQILLLTHSLIPFNYQLKFNKFLLRINEFMFSTHKVNKLLLIEISELNKKKVDEIFISHSN